MGLKLHISAFEERLFLIIAQCQSLWKTNGCNQKDIDRTDIVLRKKKKNMLRKKKKTLWGLKYIMSE